MKTEADPFPLKLSMFFSLIKNFKREFKGEKENQLKKGRKKLYI